MAGRTKIALSGFHLCGTTEEHLTGMRFVKDAEVKQAVTS
jgi:hypothetical protein